MQHQLVVANNQRPQLQQRPCHEKSSSSSSSKPKQTCQSHQHVNVVANGQRHNKHMYAYVGQRSQSTPSPRGLHDVSVLEQQQAIHDQAIYAQSTQGSPNNMQEDKQQPRVVNQSSQRMLDPAKVWRNTTAAASAPSMLSAVNTNTIAADFESIAADFESRRKEMVQQATTEAILEQKRLNSKLRELLRQGLETASRSSQDSITEGSEHSSAYSEAFKEEAERARSFMERLNLRSSSTDPKRPYSQKDLNGDPSSSDEEPEAQTTSSPQQVRSAILRKKQRKSLSSYYREMKANQSGPDLSTTTDSSSMY